MEPITSTIILITAYVIPLALLVWLWLGNLTGRKSKLLLTLLLPLFYGLHWLGLQYYKGWPTDQALPEQFELLAADIVEPGKGSGETGEIHLWIRTGQTAEPRVHALPYSRRLHETLHTTRQRAQQGRTQYGLLSEDDGTGKGARVGNGQRLEFHDQMAGVLPPKREQ